MESSVRSPLVGSEIHGFRTKEDLDVGTMMAEAKARWLRPNEIHAILCNNKYFTVNVKPVNLPKSGTIVLFDRKMFRNFRKDGYNWKKKKDGKTVKEAHEHLKVGNEERIHVYYAHGEDSPTFVRRCYWLLDKYENIKHCAKIVNHHLLYLVDMIACDAFISGTYRPCALSRNTRGDDFWDLIILSLCNTWQNHGRQWPTPVSPETSVNSNPSPAISDPPTTLPLLEEFDSALHRVYHDTSRSLLERHDSLTVKNHEQRLHEINTLEWDELLVSDDSHKLITQDDGKTSDFEHSNQNQMNSYRIHDDGPITNKVSPESSGSNVSGQVAGTYPIGYDVFGNLSYNMVGGETVADSTGLGPLSVIDSLNNVAKDGLQAQESIGRWMSYIIADSPESVNNQAVESSISTGHQSFTSPRMDDHLSTALGQIFKITNISPGWAFSTEETKILVVGVFNEGCSISTESILFLACGDSIVPAEVVQAGVFQCSISPQTPGLVNLYLSFDGHKPVSQVLTFEFRAPVVPIMTIPSENKTTWEEFQLQIRLSHLLFPSSKCLGIFFSKLLPNALKEAKAFSQKTSQISDCLMHLTKAIQNSKMSLHEAKESLFELTLQNRLHEWLLEKVVSGCKISERDEQGQGVIHLCAILGYTWAVYPFSCSGLSLDHRDKFGWTALHWAAYYGREKMVATLLSAGAKPNLVTDPTAENPGGCTAADLATNNGYDGLAAYLAEKALVSHFKDMTLAGNVSGSLQTTTNEIVNSENFSEEESYLKDTLAAYRTAADAAARIQAAFREHSFKVRTKEVQSSNPEIEARNIVAAMRIQHAYRNYETRKKISAAARIQYRFRTWKMRKDFLNLRRQTIKIQAVFRAFQARKQYRKIVWSVGIFEKAVLRWRLKRKGFRGLQVQHDETPEDPNQGSDVEEGFFQASRKQAEERVERSVVSVQAMFRSRQAQEEYRRLKLAHNQATLEYEGRFHPDTEMR